ncbi:MAG: hypothetical protein HZR80_19470 [Candidatus Heimdallarchaeota archaeon]
MPNIVICPVKKADCKELAIVFLNSFGMEKINSEMVKNVASRFKNELEKNITSFFVAEEKGKAIGLGGETQQIGS